MGVNSSKSPPNGGLRVQRVYPNGPGDIAGIEPFFDYILDVDGHIYSDNKDETLTLFTKYVNEKENQRVCLNIYNVRKKNIREVVMIPQKWNGIGLLGLTLKFDLFTNCLNQGLHVMKVYDKSPAKKAGLIPLTDYLLGTNLQLFFDIECIMYNVSNQVDKEVTLLVYNSLTETIRRTVIVPQYDWGGSGTLGLDLAVGYIHRIPYVKSLFYDNLTDSFVQKNSFSGAEDENITITTRVESKSKPDDKSLENQETNDGSTNADNTFNIDLVDTTTNNNNNSNSNNSDNNNSNNNNNNNDNSNSNKDSRDGNISFNIDLTSSSNSNNKSSSKELLEDVTCNLSGKDNTDHNKECKNGSKESDGSNVDLLELESSSNYVPPNL